MNDMDYKHELDVIIQIATNNGFSEHIIHRLNERIKNKMYQHSLTTFYHDENNAKKYISVEYNKITHNIMKTILNRYGYNIAYKNTNQLQRKLRPKQISEQDSGVYKLTCNECPMFYVGQTGRSFSKRFNEHVSEIKNATTRTHFKSNYAQHLAMEKHTYTDINTNMQIMHKIAKGYTLDRLEEIEIYKNRNSPLLINEKINTRANKLYDLILYSRQT